MKIVAEACVCLFVVCLFVCMRVRAKEVRMDGSLCVVRMMVGVVCARLCVRAFVCACVCVRVRLCVRALVRFVRVCRWCGWVGADEYCGYQLRPISMCVQKG